MQKQVNWQSRGLLPWTWLAEETYLWSTNLGVGDVDVGHVKAHRTWMERKAMKKEQELVVEGNEKADEMAKEGTDPDRRLMAAPDYIRTGETKSTALEGGHEVLISKGTEPLAVIEGGLKALRESRASRSLGLTRFRVKC